MPCAVNNQTLQQIKKEMSYKKIKTELNKKSFNFIYAGKFIERKNLDFMIEHFITTFKSNKNYIEEEKVKLIYFPVIIVIFCLIGFFYFKVHH